MPIKIMFGSLLMFVLASCTGVRPSSDYNAVVDPDAADAYHTIAAALDAAPSASKTPWRIHITAGDYYEKLTISKPNISLIGDGQTSTRLYYDAYSGLARPGSDTTWGTSGSATVTVTATDFSARDLHIENSFDYPANDALSEDDPRKLKGTQAVALMLDNGSDRALFDRVTLSGYQDTLYTKAGRSLFRHATIKGHVDFIFGSGSALFENSEIVTRARPGKSAPIGYIAAPSTDIDTPYGLVFINSRLTREDGVPDDSMGLGRPWHPTTRFPDGRYADPNAIGQAIFINCWMDSHIQAAPWHPMGGTAPDGSRKAFSPETDARFFEFANRGVGAQRDSDVHQMKQADANLFTTAQILGDWQPPAFPDERELIARLDNEMPDYTIAREYEKNKKVYSFISAIEDQQTSGFEAHRDLVYRTVDDRPLHLDIFTPTQSDGTPQPVMLSIHGGGWRSGDRSHQIPMMEALAEAGYVGAVVEYRLSREALYPAGVHDVQAAIRYLKQHADDYGIDPNRVALMGASSGAHMATLIGNLGHLPEFAGEPTIVDGIDSSIQAIANFDGVVDLESPAARTYEDKPDKVSYMALWLGGRYAERPDLWQEASPLQYAGPHSPPTLFINSAQPRFHVGREDYIHILTNEGIVSEVHTIPDTPHTFWLFHPWFDNARDLLTAFMDRVFRDAPGQSDYSGDAFDRERLQQLPEAEISTWETYLEQSQRIAQNDQALLEKELVTAGLTKPSPAHHLTKEERRMYRPNEDGSRPDWLTSEVVNNIISWQTPSGGWSKNTDVFHHARQPGQNYGVETTYVPTFDNNATFMQVALLASAWRQQPTPAIATSLEKAVALLVAAQFPNGGWPQTFPLAGGYHDWTTYNDSVIANILDLYLNILEQPQDFPITTELRDQVALSLQKGIDNVLADQIHLTPTTAGWGQQHDPITHELRPARAYELAALATSETAEVLVELMRLQEPTDEIKKAIRDGVHWLEDMRMTDTLWQRFEDQPSELVHEPGADDLWPRMVDPISGEARFGDRDGSIHTDVREVSLERQIAYAWYHGTPKIALDAYQHWPFRLKSDS